IGASIRIAGAARFSIKLLSNAEIRLNLTPLGGLSVYWVTLGPIFAPSISTSILNSDNVSRIVWAFCWISPASAGDCFFSSKSRLGGCQFGSETVTSAERSSAALSCGVDPLKLDRREDFFSAAWSTVGTPALSFRSATGVG